MSIPASHGITEAARTILQAIPGLDFVDLEQPRIGWMCNTLNAGAGVQAADPS